MDDMRVKIGALIDLAISKATQVERERCKRLAWMVAANETAAGRDHTAQVVLMLRLKIERGESCLD
jgi:hypothetical protein